MVSRRKIGRFLAAVLCAVPLLCVALGAGASLSLCFCDPDPDDCGRACHDCSRSDGPSCAHVSLDAGDLFPVQSAVSVPQIAVAEPPSFPLVVTSSGAPFRSRPCAAAPPDGGGSYLRISPRLYPRA